MSKQYGCPECGCRKVILTVDIKTTNVSVVIFGDDDPLDFVSEEDQEQDAREWTSDPLFECTNCHHEFTEPKLREVGDKAGTTVKEHMSGTLKAAGFDGLFLPGECCCTIEKAGDQLSPSFMEFCDYMGGCANCEPGHLLLCNDDCGFCGDPHIGMRESCDEKPDFSRMRCATCDERLLGGKGEIHYAACGTCIEELLQALISAHCVLSDAGLRLRIWRLLEKHGKR